MGNTVTLRGKAKYLGGVGTKVTGISRRKFKPNLQRLRVTVGRGTAKTLLVCTQCIKGGGGHEARAPAAFPPAERREGQAHHAGSGAVRPPRPSLTVSRRPTH